MNKLLIASASGGLDSTTLIYRALSEDFDVLTVGFEYSQKNVCEMLARKAILSQLKIQYSQQYLGDHTVSLTNTMSDIFGLYETLRDDGSVKTAAKHEFYTPSRNMLFAVMSAVVGETVAIAKGYNAVYIGLGIHKHSNEAYGEHKDYWDITPEFASKLSKLFALNDVVELKTYTPYNDCTKTEVVKDAMKLGVPYKQTWTCYSPVEQSDAFVPCGQCESCVERKLAGVKAGVMDINDYKVAKK